MSEHATTPNDCAFTIPESGELPAAMGLTKREYFAAMAMQGCISAITLQDLADAAAKGISGIQFSATVAVTAVKDADALITELNKEKPNE